MYLSLTTWLFEHLDVPDMVRHVGRCGFDSIEVSGSRAYARWDMGEVARACGDAGITVRSVHCAHHSVEGLEDDDTAYADFHEEFYDRISCFEDVVVIEHVRFDPAVAGRTQERLLRLAARCADRGFTCSTENMVNPSQAQWDILRQALSGPVQLTLDAKHAAAAGIDPLDYFEFADSIVNIHALDHYTGAPFGDWIPVGVGDIDWCAILARLADIGYEGPLTVELNERNVRSIVERVSATAVLADWADGCGELLDDARLEEMCAIASRRRLETLLDEIA